MEQDWKTYPVRKYRRRTWLKSNRYYEYYEVGTLKQSVIINENNLICKFVNSLYSRECYYRISNNHSFQLDERNR